MVSNKYIRRKCLFKTLNHVYTTKFQRHCQRQMAWGEITLFVGNSARTQLILTHWMVQCPIPPAMSQAGQETQPGQEHGESSTVSSQLYLGYMRSYRQNAARKILFYFIFFLLGRGRTGKSQSEEKMMWVVDACWYRAAVWGHALCPGDEQTHSQTVLQSISCGYGFQDELTLSHLLYFSHKLHQILLR